MLMQRQMGDSAEIQAWRGRVLIAAMLLLSLTYWAATVRAPSLALHLVRTQDVPVLAIGVIAMVALAWWQPGWRLPSQASNRQYAAAGAIVAGLLALGTYTVMGNFALSRDEHMVLFDMAVFKSGRLAVPIAAEWRPYALALVPNFLLNTRDPVGFVSAYLPAHAALRAAFSVIADPAWFNPLLVFAGGAALLNIARRTFPGDGRTQLVVMLIYALSAQVLTNAMTAYSMTAHLACNLIWLAAFLRGGRAGHAVAIATGLVATGLHQVAFHPVFVAPFLLWRLRNGEWKIVLGYAVAYAAIILWWAYYQTIVAPLVAGSVGAATRDSFFSQVVLPMLTNRDTRAIPLTILNLMRLLAWQHLALLPLLIAAIPTIRQEAFPKVLALGVGLWLLFIVLVMPDQGRGWGYRYMNGYLGSLALLAGYGYQQLAAQLRARADGLIICLSGLTLVASLPLLFGASHDFLRPHLALDRLIERQHTPLVLIDDENSPTLNGRFRDMALDHVRNLPDLSNRPIRLGSRELTPPMLLALCRKSEVTLITRRDMHGLGFILNVPERSPEFEALVTAVSRAAPRCLRAASLNR